MVDQHMGQLSTVAIRKAGPDRLYDGNGLELLKRDDIGKWARRHSFAGKR